VCHWCSYHLWCLLWSFIEQMHNNMKSTFLIIEMTLKKQKIHTSVLQQIISKHQSNGSQNNLTYYRIIHEIIDIPLPFFFSDSHLLDGYLPKNQTCSWVTTVKCPLSNCGEQKMSQFKQNRKFWMVIKMKEDLFFCSWLHISKLIKGS